ncbi:MAG: NfeD family protein [Glaciimonas sp.]|nr:NfeD family protein [Glaciimonas sp.]
MLMAGVLIIAELFTGTFYLLMVALGLIAGGIAALIGFSMESQLLVAAVVAVVATIALRRSRFGRRGRVQAERDPNVNLDIGQIVTINAWQQSAGDGGVNTARVMYRGAQWDVELASGEVAHVGQFLIQEIRGSRLIVTVIK